MSSLQVIAQEIKLIKETFQNISKNDVSIEDIEAHISRPIPRRTLQRRLSELQKEGFIDISGKTKSSRYCLASKKQNENTSLESDIAKQTVENSSIPLSINGSDILTLCSMPIQNRKRVGYNRLFLENYQPNINFYLNEDERQKLKSIATPITHNQPAGTYAKDILSRLLIDLSWNSSRLEGNTYSLLDTQRLIAFGETPNLKTQAETQMILNHKDAIEFLSKLDLSSADQDIGFNRYTILNLHAMLSNNLLPDPSAVGRLRKMEIGISASVYEPLSTPQVIEEMFNLTLHKASLIQDPFEQSFFMMVHIPYLQPFDDVNKRVSRLASNIPFLQHHLSPLSFIDVPDHIYIVGMLGIYELNRIDLLKDIFMWAYARSATRYAALKQILGEPDSFRILYREEMKHLITDIIKQCLLPHQASQKIEVIAATLAQKDRAHFIEMISTELLSLHDGNFARYLVTPSEFATWKIAWGKN